MSTNYNKIDYPLPNNFDYILRYYKTKVDKYIRNGGNMDLVRVNAREISKLIIGEDVNNFEIGVVNPVSAKAILECSVCKGKFNIIKPQSTSLRDNNTFCYKCGLIRFLFNRTDLESYTFVNKPSSITNSPYLMVDGIVIYKDLYTKLIMSVRTKLINRLAKYIESDIKAIIQSDINNKEDNI